MDISRRKFLGLGALAGASAVAAGAGELLSRSGGPDDKGAFKDGASRTPSVKAEAASFEGRHQLAMLSEPTPAAAIVSFDVVGEDRSELRQLLETLTDRMRRLYRGGMPEDLGPAAPADDNGLLGPVIPHRQVAFMLGFGASLFDERFGLGKRRPARLEQMQSFPNDDLQPGECDGDISLWVGAAEADTVVHALRDITKHTRGAMQPRWRMDGFKSPPRPSGTPRNLLGFMDGIANPDSADAAQMRDLVFVPKGSPEPAWTEGGTYQVIRVIRMLVEFWDRVSVYEQENMIGRRRASGAPLDGDSEYSSLDYKADPEGLVIPLTAHIRLANPRTPETEKNRILRRGWNYDGGLDSNGNLDQGLLFVCYQQDIQRQFVVNQTRLINEPLVDYISPIGGGYFFCPPGLDGKDGFIGSGMFD